MLLRRLLPACLILVGTNCRDTIEPATSRSAPRGGVRSGSDASTLDLPPILDLGTLSPDGTSGWSAGTAINSHGNVVGWSNLNNYMWDASTRSVRFLGNPWGDWSSATGINENDVVVGRTAYVAWVWDASNGMQLVDISSPSATGHVCKGGASGLNLAGEVVGLQDNCAGSQGFVFPTSTMGPLSLIEGFSGGQKINDLGQVIFANQIFNSRQGTFITLPGFGGQTNAYDINNNSQVVGSSGTASGVEHAFIWSQSTGAMTDLGALCGAARASRANGVNLDGRVVGWCENADGQKRAVIWDASLRTMTELGALPGYCCSVANDISDNGLIAGTSGVTDLLVINGPYGQPGVFHNPVAPTGVEHATLWTAPPMGSAVPSVDLPNSCGHAITGVAFDGSYYYVGEGHNSLTQCITRYTSSGVLLDYKQFDVDIRGLHFVPATGKLVSRTWNGNLFEIDYAAGTSRALTTFNPTPGYGSILGVDQSQPAADPDGVTFWIWNNTLGRAEQRQLSDNSVITSFSVQGGYMDVPAIAVSNDAVFLQNDISIYAYNKRTGQFLDTTALTASTHGCQGYGFGAPIAGDRIMYDVDCSHARVEPVTLVLTHNAPPVAVTNGALSGSEGTSVSFDGSASTDPDGDPLSYTWDFGDGAAGLGKKVTHAYVDNGVYTASLTVADPQGATNTKPVAVTIANAAPRVSLVAIPINPGESFKLPAIFRDLGVNDGPWAYRIDWGDGSAIETGTAQNQPAIDRTHSFTAAGPHIVAVFVTDKDGAVGSASAQLQVNAPPRIISIGGPYIGAEGVGISFTGKASDPDGDPLTYRWDFGDGSTAASGSPVSNHVYADNGSCVVALAVVDSKGVQSAPTTTTATITNVAPKATFNGPASVNEGDSFTLSLSNVVDAPGDLSTLAYAMDCGDGLGYSAFGPANSRTCPTSDNGSRVTRGQVRDKDGGTTTYSRSVSVLNVPPVVTAASLATTVKTNFNMTFRFGDVGELDGPWSYQINWGDGSKTTSPIAVVTNWATITASYSYKRVGTYTVTISVTDKNGGVGTATPQAAVK